MPFFGFLLAAIAAIVVDQNSHQQHQAIVSVTPQPVQATVGPVTKSSGVKTVASTADAVEQALFEITGISPASNTELQAVAGSILEAKRGSETLESYIRFSQGEATMAFARIRSTKKEDGEVSLDYTVAQVTATYSATTKVVEQVTKSSLLGGSSTTHMVEN